MAAADLDETVSFFTETLGFRLEVIFPADDPRVAVIERQGARLRLERRPDDPSGGFLLLAPRGGAELAEVEAAPLGPPDTEPVVSRRGDEGWKRGRAGMGYRDLVPGRHGGRFVASHIRVEQGGPVPDYVHFHEIRFQLIYCRAGWVRVVYEDQGPPFVLEPGDAVLQPPRIRHRVLECSPGLEVIELACPAEHPTRVDHDLALPTETVRPDRDHGGQRFVRHEAAKAEWQLGPADGFERRDLGIAAATRGLAAASVLRRRGSQRATVVHQGGLVFWYVLAGAATFATETIRADDSITVPAGCACMLDECSDDFELLEVTLESATG